ncbi:MAG: alpha-2-macroglobulin family protein, partial [Bacteroidia bacterium]|nr:alpha-2-macroglobulin family protein [Bacteroidia bacterium]
MKPIYLLFAVAIVLFTYCSKKDTVQLVEKNFQEEVPLMTNLSFIFDKNLVEERDLNFWDTVEYIVFEPEIKGRFMWTAENTLVFSPIRQLAPSTAYTGELTDLLVKGKALKLTGEKEFQFHTPYLSLINAVGYWAAPDNEPANASVNISFNFNYQVRPSDLADKLSVEIDGNKKNFTLITKEPDESLAIFLPGIKFEDKTLSGKIKIAEGMNAAYGTVATQEEITRDVDIPTPFKLSIQDISAQHDGVTGKVTVYTSQRINTQDAKDFISFAPEIQYSIDVKEQEFIISSDEFDAEESYEITIKEGLKGQLGGILKYDFTQNLSFGQLQPCIRFLNKKSAYLSGKGSREIEVSIVNIPKVKVTITKVYENNIISFIGNEYGYYYGDDYGYDDYYYDEYYYGTSYSNAYKYGDVVYEQEYLTKDLPRSGKNTVIKLDFPDKLLNYNGLYVVNVSSVDDYWLQDGKILTISDIGLITKAGKNKIHVFANSIKNAEPLSNVEISFIGENNQVAKTIKTDADGVAILEQGALPAPGFSIQLVTASHSGDFNYINFNKSQVNTADFDIGGFRENISGYNAFIYGDRDIYRPGETINITGILRTHQWNAPGQIPVKIKFLLPNGNEYKTIRKTLNEHGSFETSLSLPPAAMTGSYTVQILTSNDVYINSKWVKVEEFVPDRINVKVEPDKKELKPGQDLNLHINAMNFFGPPAAQRNYEVEQSLMRKYFSPKKNYGYNYDIVGAESYFQKIVRTGKTDDQGNAVETFHIPEHYAHMGVLLSDYFITVFDETCRPVNRRKSINIYTQDVFYGIEYCDSYYKTGIPVQIPVIAADKDGNALNNIPAEITLIKHEYKTVLNKSGEYFRYRSEHEEKILENQVITINGTETVYSFIPDMSGNYEIRISAPDINTYVSRTIYCYGWGMTSFSSFQVNNDGKIDIVADKEQYQVGDKAKLILRAPFSGKVLVTVENNKVVEYFYKETDKRALSFDLNIKEEYIPNVYITATLFKPHEKTDLPYTVAHGFASLMAENPVNKLTVQIEAAKQSRSNTKQKIVIRSKPNSAVTVAAVDEGILQVTGYETPDPYNYFYAKRALEVNSYDIYPYLFPEIIASLQGGDGMDMEKRINPMTNKRFKLVSFWSGILETDNSGEAEFEISIPQFSGDLRIMTVNYKAQSFGSAFTNMKVADPLVISTALPRFLSPGDTIDVPVNLSNTTKNKTGCTTKLQVNGPLQVIGKETMKLDIGANSESVALFKVASLPKIGEAKVTVLVEGNGEKFTNETDITVRPASPLIKYNGCDIIYAGETKVIKMDASSFIASSIDNKLIVSKSPLIQFSDDLEYLLRYPYGCIEQTVSSAFPQIYYQDIIKDIFKGKDKNNISGYNVQEAIKRLKLMQLYNGGLTYWPEAGYETWWGTVYGAHFLVEAKKAGFDVDADMLEKIFDYLTSRLKKKEFTTYYYNTNKKKDIAPKEVPYSLYVLALADEPQRAVMNYYKSNIEQLSLDGRYLLAAAFALAGDKKSFEQILPDAFEGEVS